VLGIVDQGRRYALGIAALIALALAQRIPTVQPGSKPQPG
jgi:hypothetical protein